MTDKRAPDGEDSLSQRQRRAETRRNERQDIPVAELGTVCKVLKRFSLLDGREKIVSEIGTIEVTRIDDRGGVGLRIRSGFLGPDYILIRLGASGALHLAKKLEKEARHG